MSLFGAALRATARANSSYGGDGSSNSAKECLGVPNMTTIAPCCPRPQTPLGPHSWNCAPCRVYTLGTRSACYTTGHRDHKKSPSIGKKKQEKIILVSVIVI